MRDGQGDRDMTVLAIVIGALWVVGGGVVIFEAHDL